MKNHPAHAHKLRRNTCYRFLITIALLTPLLQACAQNPPRPVRADSFFGVHFDFHATNKDKQIGQTVTPAMVDQFLTTVRPDFIQVDAKGNPGVASFYTKVGKQGGIVKDQLKIFRQVTAKRGVALYAHYSSLVDYEIAQTRPEWAIMDAAGKKNTERISFFSDYVDKYFIPQIKEISDYGLDGMWVDADNYVVKTDYSPAALKAYSASRGKKATRALDVDKKDYLQFTREAYRKYLNHYVRAIKKYNPKFEIGSNWAFTSRMPGPVDAPVAFLSGDLASNIVSEINFENYGMASQGLPWDLMSWAANTDNHRFKYHWKSPVQLQQHAALTLSLGGAYELYIVQNRDGAIPQDNLMLQTAKEVRDFCFERKPFCFKSTTIPQVALFVSAAGHYRESQHPFNSDNQGSTFASTTLDMLLDAKYSVQMLNEHNLKGKTAKYPLIVIPQTNYIEPAMVNEFKAYVKNGGRIVVIGPSVSKMLTSNLGNGTSYGDNAGLTMESFSYGKGVVLSVIPRMSLKELKQREDQIKNTVATALAKIFPNPLVSIDSSSNIHLHTAAKNGETLINLVNVSKVYASGGGSLPNTIKPTPPLKVTLRMDKKPSSIKWQPDNTNINFSYSNGLVMFTTPPLDMYSIIQVK
ncbi:alpha-amylase family protein [Mucilaginibacter hurinus]|nr:hypothetical protein [Mucilaginibacter hurinus]